MVVVPSSSKVVLGLPVDGEDPSAVVDWVEEVSSVPVPGVDVQAATTRMSAINNVRRRSMALRLSAVQA